MAVGAVLAEKDAQRVAGVGRSWTHSERTNHAHQLPVSSTSIWLAHSPFPSFPSACVSVSVGDLSIGSRRTWSSCDSERRGSAHAEEDRSSRTSRRRTGQTDADRRPATKGRRGDGRPICRQASPPMSAAAGSAWELHAAPSRAQASRNRTQQLPGRRSRLAYTPRGTRHTEEPGQRGATQAECGKIAVKLKADWRVRGMHSAESKAQYQFEMMTVVG